METNKKELKDYEIPVLSNYILDATQIIQSDSDIQIYTGIEINTKEKVVFKLKQKTSHDSYYILQEGLIYKELKGIKRIPKLYTAGEQGNYNILITELLGESLKMLLKSVGEKFSLATTLKISIQVLNIIEEIHKKGFVLRYLKPGNMVIGRGENKDYIYLIDFEIAKKYIKYGEHILYKVDKRIKGNRDFISLNTHLGKEISRRDDIESLGYNLIYFMKGKLPWSHLYDSRLILFQKMKTSIDELCEGLPEEFEEFINYSKELKFEQEPDYKYLKELLIKAGEKNGIDINKVKYDWDIKNEEIKEKEEKMNKIEEDKGNTKEEEKEVEEIKENKERIGNIIKVEKKIKNDKTGEDEQIKKNEENKDEESYIDKEKEDKEIKQFEKIRKDKNYDGFDVEKKIKKAE